MGVEKIELHLGPLLQPINYSSREQLRLECCSTRRFKQAGALSDQIDKQENHPAIYRIESTNTSFDSRPDPVQTSSPAGASQGSKEMNTAAFLNASYVHSSRDSSLSLRLSLRVSATPINRMLPCTHRDSTGEQLFEHLARAQQVELRQMRLELAVNSTLCGFVSDLIPHCTSHHDPHCSHMCVRGQLA